jgi:rod shape-determining protein MreD
MYIAIFYWILKKPERLGYGLVFFAGIINDVVQNFPIGVSSINYLLLCSIALFIRSRTLVPNLLYDWLFFLIAILIISSVHYSILTTIFDLPIRYGTLMSSSMITFLVYPMFSKLFNQIYLLDLRQENAK